MKNIKYLYSMDTNKYFPGDQNEIMRCDDMMNKTVMISFHAMFYFSTVRPRQDVVQI